MDDYLKTAHQGQISKLGRQILQARRQLTIATIQNEGLEVYCVAGGRLDPAYFKSRLLSDLAPTQ